MDVYEPRHLPRYEDTAAYRYACRSRGVDELTVLEGCGRRESALQIGAADIERPRQTREQALAVFDDNPEPIVDRLRAAFAATESTNAR